MEQIPRSTEGISCVLPWQRVRRRQVVTTPWNWQTLKTPLWYRNLGIICYGNQVTANTAVGGPQCGVWWKRFSLIVNPALYLNLVQKTNSHQRLAVRFWTSRKSFSLQSYIAKCDILWPSIVKENFTGSHSPLPLVPHPNKLSTLSEWTSVLYATVLKL